MVYTINGGEPWEYISLLNECIKIILTVFLGVVFGYFRAFDAAQFVPQAVGFVFRVALPLLVLRGLGIMIDFYDPDFDWLFMVAFLLLRVIALAFAFGFVLTKARMQPEDKTHDIGEVAVVWLALTWISTVILGIPISKALFGSEKLGVFYGIMAGISSFIFQLPLQLLFLECHALLRDDKELNAASPSESALVEQGESLPPATDDKEEHVTDVKEEYETDVTRDDIREKAPPSTSYPLRDWLQYAGRRDVWTRILFKMSRNNVIWGIIGGFILSISTIGPRYLDPMSDKFVPGLGWIFATLGWFGDCVSPVSLFTMGVWMQSQDHLGLYKIPPLTAVLYMVAKLILTPLLMVGLAEALQLEDAAGRAAVLIAALPISLASFSLASTYDIGQALLAENVILGTILLLPTILVWNVSLDAVGLYEIPE